MSKSIILSQAPIIKHELEKVGNKVSNRISELKLTDQVATEATIQTLKSTRAELNKEFQEFEEQRKIIKNAVLNPYSEFEDVYKTKISEQYKQADETLKNKINEFELAVKEEKKKNLVKYLEELKEFNQLDWLKFEHAKIDNISLSTSEKKYKEQILSFVDQVISDIELIETDKYSAEILVEYKKTLNVSNAIKTIRERKDAERLESERLSAERSRKRQSSLRTMNFVFHDLTRTFNCVHDDSIMVSLKDIEELSDDEWAKRFADLESKAVVKNNTIQVLKTPVVVTPTIEKPKEEILEAAFRIKGTYRELMNLSEFLKSNNYQYENI